MQQQNAREVFSRSRWIWSEAHPGNDDYAEFYAELPSGEPTLCRLSCDGDYTLFINGRYAASNQYGDYEHYKIYDELDLTPFLREGRNDFALLVWHFGASSQRYIPAQAGVIFELVQKGKPVLASGPAVLCRRSRAYRSGECRCITRQLGFGFAYDATREDGWLTGRGQGFHPAVEVEKHCSFYPRPTEKLRVREEIPARPVKGTPPCGGAAESRRWLLDLGAETVGLFTFALRTDTEQELRISYGEHIEDGCVRRRIGDRDFSFAYRAKLGENTYTNYMLRLGCRYIEITGERPFVLLHAGLLPQNYPVTRIGWQPAGALDRRIWELCLRTLELCMMEHYVDCPWREQCLYVFDARNQMLCGYDGFVGGNAAYARANLLLMSRDRREDGLLSICFPCGEDLVIPSFSLYYFLAVREYFEHTGDAALLREVYPKLQSVLGAFLAGMENGLVNRFSGTNRWNFYDWSPDLSGSLGREDGGAPDLMLNGLFLLALGACREICRVIGEPFAYEGVLADCRRRTRETFLRTREGLFSLHPEGEVYRELPNALAVLCGLCEGEEAAGVCRRIAAHALPECSLSMKTLVYDALLATDPAYREFVLNDIRTTYGAMLEAGATAAWETKEGASAFHQAGSLCHGWSAIPVHYLRRLL